MNKLAEATGYWVDVALERMKANDAGSTYRSANGSGLRALTLAIGELLNEDSVTMPDISTIDWRRGTNYWRCIEGLDGRISKSNETIEAASRKIHKALTVNSK